MERSFAQQLLEQLSENISQFILTVLTTKEKNESAPVVEVTAIANAASSLSDVAVQLANDEYSKFTNIYNEIIETTSRMSKIKKQTLYAVTNFDNNNKNASWNALIESCKCIATETYTILQVIYDADIKRLKHLNDLSKEQMKTNLNSFHLVDNSEFNKFGDIINESISSLLEYSSYVNVKAKEIRDIAPLVSDELIQDADRIEVEGNRLIDIVNDMFADIDDPSQKQLFIQQQDSLNSLLDKTYSTIELNSPSLSLNINYLAPLASSTTGAVDQDSTTDPNINDNETSILDDLIRGVSKSSVELLRAVCRVDPVANEIISNSVEKITLMLDENVNKWAQEQTQGGSKDERQEEAKQISKMIMNELVPGLLQRAKLVIEKQQSSDNFGEIQQDINKVVEVLDSIHENLGNLSSIVSSKESQFLNIIKAKEDGLAVLQDSVQNHAAIVGTLKHLAKNQTQLESILGENSPEEINEAVSKLSELLPLQIQAAKLYLKDPNNPETKSQFQEIGDRMKLPLSKIVSLMEPNKYNDSDEILAKQVNGSAMIIEAAKQGDANRVEQILKDLEMANATLVSIVQGETILADDPLLEKMIKTTSDQLLQHVSERRGLSTKLLKDPHNKDTQNQLIQCNQKIANLSKSLTDSMKSLEAIPLLKIQLLEAAKQGNPTKAQSILKDINNRVNAIIYNGNNLNDNLLNNENKEEKELLFKEIKELENYLNQLNKEVNNGIKSNQLQNIGNNLDYTTDNIINKLNEAALLSSNNDGVDDELFRKEFEIIQENKENERKLEQQQEEEFKKLEKLSNDQKLLSLFNDLIQHIKKSEANKSMLTLKQLISEQDKLIQLANELSLKSKSQSFKDQVAKSIQLFKNSVALAISLAGKANLPENEISLSKATKTVKKSIIELTHLLVLNPNIELLASYQLLKEKSNQNDLLNHIRTYSKEASLEFKNVDAPIKGFEKHQLNSRYYIQTAYEVDKDDLISQAIENIVYQQSELLLMATEYLNSIDSSSVDNNVRKLLINSIQTVKKSIIEQVESSLVFLDTKNNNKEEAIEKLLTVIDTVRDSVSTLAKSVFTAKSNQQHSPTFSSETIKQSINSVLPSLTLAKTKLNSNPQDNQYKNDYEKILNQIIEPLEDLILNQNFNENFKLDKLENNDSSSTSSDDQYYNNFKKLKKLVNDENVELNKLEANALESDSKGVVESSRVLVKLHQEIVSLADQFINDESLPPIGGSEEIIKECSKELTLLIPLQLTTIKQMLQSTDIPTEAALQKKISHVNNQIKRNLNQIENQISPSLPHLKVPFYRDQFKKITKEIDNNGQVHQDEKKLRNNLRKLEHIANQSLEAGNNELLKVFDKEKQRRVRDACEELEKRLNKNQPTNLTNTIQLYSLNPKNPSNRAQFEKESHSFQNAINKLADETNTNSLELLSNHLDLIQKMVTNSSKLNNGGNVGKIDEKSKEILSNYSKLKEQLAKDLIHISNPEKKATIISCLNEIETTTPELIRASRNNCNSDDQTKREHLETLLNKIETPIYEILSILDSIDPIYNFETAVKEHQSTLNQLNDALKSNNEPKVNQLLTKLQNIQNKIKPILKQDNNNSNKKNIDEIEAQIKSKMSDVSTISKDYLKNYNSITPNIIAEQEMAFSALKNAMNAIYSNEIPELLEKREKINQNSQSKSKTLQQLVASIKTNNLLPIAANPNKIERFVSVQTNTQQPVLQRVTSTASVNYKPRAMSISQKLINTNNTAKANNTAAIKPNTTVTTNIQQKPQQPQQPQEIRKPVKLSNPITPTKSNTGNGSSKPTTSAPLPINNNPMSLEDSVINASNQIQNSNSGLDNHKVTDIAKELELYANAIKTNQKQLMVLCSRNISVLLNKYSDEVSTTAKSSTNKLLQSRMSHSVNVLKTLSCQFKILTGVKAASSSEQDADADSDSQLTSLVKLLSSTLLDLNTSLITNSKVNKK
ncbi:hypothetical protein DICPUDRAFT_93827 [Dictyostelium purpureum]|uniref:Uncharacterized protein n=1 Tax=Dictyostelium purpureum TaxID=5786 RepID=F0ZC47_DICPU|nr:uncharacterized protein DICPUDRAFT_93827 [Dictyostelium purpureum]EGC38432.1 hypothetical protein DICPUDRAFT_93827 [Dictyostelium purpureum]|eukprot:XP_003284990.1 hypothetical protein DICPUDRAFT_93827 [Dictyostelium purpureum]